MPSYFVVVFCFSDMSLLSERARTKHRFDRYFEHFYYSVTSSIVGFFSFSRLFTVVLGNLQCFLFRIPSASVLSTLLFLTVHFEQMRQISLDDR